MKVNLQIIEIHLKFTITIITDTVRIFFPIAIWTNDKFGKKRRKQNRWKYENTNFLMYYSKILNLKI